MQQHLANFRFRTRWQIYGRLAPALAVAVAAACAVGWLAYGHWSRQAAVGDQARELVRAAELLRERAAFETAALELRQLAGQPAAGGAVVAVLAPDDPLVAHLVGYGAIGTAAVPAVRAGFAIVLHAPCLVADPRPGRQGRIAVLPAELRRAGTAAAAGPEFVALLDLALLLPPLDPELAWWCVATLDGEVVLAADGSVPPGTCLVGASARGRRLGPGLPVAVVGSLVKTPGWREHRIEGAGASPWVVGSHRAAGLPLTLIAATRAHRMQELALVSFAAVIAVGLLALAVGLAGMARVVDGVSARLAALGANMEALARGDYTRRLPRGPGDEVGRLIGYFNLMAASLEEAHRQVKDKAANLKAALENQRLLDRAKDEFLVLISHEVRTPLTAILGGIAFLRSTLERATPADRAVLERLNLAEIAEVIASSGERLNGFMTDAIQMTTIQSGLSRLDLVPVSPAALLAPGLARIAPWARNRGISVENGLADDPGWQVLCDPVVLQVAVQKVLDNAVVHNLDGGRVIVRETPVAPGFGPAETLATPDQVQRLREQPGWATWSGEPIAWRLLEVHNTGRAIPRDRIDALFGKFELVGRIEHHSRGSGLSLPIAKAAVEQHGGRILVHSEEGWGTAFYLLLPTLPVAAGGRGGLWDDAPQGVGRRTGHEQVGVAADRAGLEVELDHHGAARPGDGDQAGGGPDGARGADHEEHLTV